MKRSMTTQRAGSLSRSRDTAVAVFAAESSVRRPRPDPVQMRRLGSSAPPKPAARIPPNVQEPSPIPSSSPAASFAANTNTVNSPRQLPGGSSRPQTRDTSVSAATSSPSLPVVIADSVNLLRDRPDEGEYNWAQDSYNSTQRTIDTWSFFVTFRSQLYLLDQKWSYIGGFSEQKKRDRTRGLARYLLESILHLGPTFIKIGQLSSTRADLFPAEFVQELSKLQDRVPAFSAEKAAEIVERDLGQPISKLFKRFDTRPIAAASLGQVHRAVLWTGEEVVVKVQRPGLKQLFDIDLENLRILSEQLDKQGENRDFKGIYQESAAVLYQEIDYINEGRNSDRFRRNFKDVPWVKVPRVYWEYSSPRVLTLEYMPGIKITDVTRLQAANIDTKLVAKRTTEAYLLQLLRHGFYHADQHPGNVAVIPSGPEAGALVFYDFGMMGEIVPNVREKLLDVFYGIYRKDVNLVIKALTDLQVIKATGSDQLSLRRAISFFISSLARQTERQEAIANIGEDLFAIATDQPFRFPANFTFVLRAFSTLEGIGKALDPDYKFTEVAQPYAQELLDLQDAQSRNSLLVQQVQQQASELTAAAAAMPMRIQRIDTLLEQLEAGDIKLRVRALEVERSSRRSGIMQSATMATIGSMGFLNVGTMLALSGMEMPASLALAMSVLCGMNTAICFQRIKRLDQFERDIKGGK